MEKIILCLVLLITFFSPVFAENSLYKLSANKSNWYVKDGYRFKVEKLPDKYFLDFSYQPKIEYDIDDWFLSERGYLLMIYDFIHSTPQDRIAIVEGEIKAHPEELAYFMDTNRQYMIANNYCIAVYYDNEWGMYNVHRVQCYNPLPITTLPYEKCRVFKKNDSDGVYYIDFNVNALWKEFEQFRNNKIQKQYDEEVKTIAKQMHIYAQRNFK